MKKLSAVLLILALMFTLCPVQAFAESSGLKEGASSLLVPGWGQYQNGEFQSRGGKIKSGIMIAVEIAAIVTTAVVGGTVGYPVVWAGIGLFIANHAWSCLDAFMNAGKKVGVALGTEAPIEKASPAAA